MKEVSEFVTYPGRSVWNVFWRSMSGIRRVRINMEEVDDRGKTNEMVSSHSLMKDKHAFCRSVQYNKWLQSWSGSYYRQQVLRCILNLLKIRCCTLRLLSNSPEAGFWYQYGCGSILHFKTLHKDFLNENVLNISR